MMDADGKNQKAKKTGVGFEPMINDDSKSTLSLDTAILEKGAKALYFNPNLFYVKKVTKV